MADSVERISLTLPPELVEELDALVESGGYASRSKAFRNALRAFLADHRQRTKLSGIKRGSVTIVYDHDATGLNDELTRLQHHHEDLIVATQHIHFDAHLCLETVVVDGSGDAITTFVERVESLDGVKQAQLTII